MSFAAKRVRTGLPLWLLFLAVQFVDILWAFLVLVGVEKVRIVPGITASNPLDLYYMPYTHSLIGAVVWSLVAIPAAARWSKKRFWKAGFVLAVAVFSHWFLDLVVHRPDLPLYDNKAKVGLGLWNQPILALTLEALILFGGMAIYLQSTKRAWVGGTWGFAAFGAVLLGVQAVVFFGSPPPTDRAAALTALVSYFVFAGAAGWLDRKRARPVESLAS